MTRLVLASASSGRLRVLRGAGVEPLVVVSAVDEDAIISAQAGAAPDTIVTALAVAKARDVASRLPTDVAADCVVVGCDSMLFRDSELHGKPGTATAAKAQWHSMAGRSGQLYSGHCLLRLREAAIVTQKSAAALTTVHFGTPTAEDLTAYIDSGEPLGVAGAFTLDGLGGWFIDRIEGDPANVIGLSLPLTRSLLAAVGVSITDLWATNRVGKAT
ncbi:Maf family protein [Mycolicibacterium komossense]|uniref:Nucleoside triphosphate pyrophosphatase n=1 Tax=Mycolicibacterium komossense TaxID=1779 RepID=A0ABT3CCI8_9MYCO|nr:nucleoside triphosphate pyrophosphatase [Mycolicibacterium komossense]MCV7227183.1 septum formation inhibitor Maf [Mycolicibacterium komossense]